MHKLFILGCLSFASAYAEAEPHQVGTPTIFNGKCMPVSNVASGSSDANLDEHSTPFACDTAVVTPLPGHRVMVHFLRKADKRGDLVGFAGDLIDANNVDVDHFYLNDGKTLQATKGQCTFFDNPAGGFKSIVCGARLERGDLAVAAVIGFDILPKSRKRRG